MNDTRKYGMTLACHPSLNLASGMQDTFMGHSRLMARKVGLDLARSLGKSLSNLERFTHGLVR